MTLYVLLMLILFGTGAPRLEHCIWNGGSLHTTGCAFTSIRFTDHVHDWLSSYVSRQKQIIRTHTGTSEAVALTCMCHKAQSSVHSSSPHTLKMLKNSLRHSLLKTIFMQMTPRCSHICVSVKFSVKNRTKIEHRKFFASNSRLVLQEVIAPKPH